MKYLIYSLAILVTGIATASAAEYYVDFEGGNNASSGLSPQDAWKHSPGDANATGKPASTVLSSGDIVRFKGGVQYLGEIKLETAGREGKPIILDGNVDGTYGEGRAILDGAQTISEWQKVASAEDVKGNPNWKEILYADLDVDLSTNFKQDKFILHRETKAEKQAPWQRIFLIDGERRVLPVAQRPKPSDPFFPDLPSNFHLSPKRVTSSYPHKVYYETGTKGNATLPLIAITFGGDAPVIEPLNGGAVSVEMEKPQSITAIGFTLYRPKTTPAPERIVFLADDKEIHTVDVDPNETGMQRFDLPKTVEAHKLTFQLQNSAPDAPKWTKFQQIAAFTKEGENVIAHKITSMIEDPERLTQEEPDWYDNVFVGVHGGNNHVYFAQVERYDPASHTLYVPHFSAKIYDKTRYALFNSPRFIDQPGEWSVAPLEGGRTRIYFWPEHVENGRLTNLGYPALKTAVTLAPTASHIEIRGFLMQRYAGGRGGVATLGNGAARPAHIRIADCEMRFMSGQSGISLNSSDHVKVENCFVHHCPGWTVGIYVNRVNHYHLTGNHIDNNSGSGIRHYEAKDGLLEGNVVTNHYGMHSSGLNFYEGCADIRFEGNYVQNVIVINRNAENLTFRNNVVDSQHRNPVSVAMWVTGRTGGKDLNNILFENNTFVNVAKDADWASSIFVQKGKASPPEGLVIRNNILDRLRPPVPGLIENNIFMRETGPNVTGSPSLLVADPKKLFIDPEKGDFRRKPGGPLMDVGASVPPPSQP